LAVSYATPIAPFTLAGSVAVAGAGMAMDKYGNDTDKKVAREIKDVFSVTESSMSAGEMTGNTIGNYKGWER